MISVLIFHRIRHLLLDAVCYHLTQIVYIFLLLETLVQTGELGHLALFLVRWNDDIYRISHGSLIGVVGYCVGTKLLFQVAILVDLYVSFLFYIPEVKVLQVDVRIYVHRRMVLVRLDILSLLGHQLRVWLSWNRRGDGVR